MAKIVIIVVTSFTERVYTLYCISSDNVFRCIVDVKNTQKSSEKQTKANFNSTNCKYNSMRSPEIL